MKKLYYFTLAFTSKFVKCQSIVLQGLYTMHNTFYMFVFYPRAMITHKFVLL